MKIEYRISGSGSDYITLADDTATGGTIPRISGYKPSLRASPTVEPLCTSPGEPFASFVMGASGQWSVSFAVDRQHASVDAALEFLQTHPSEFAVADRFDLKITQGASIRYLPACAITSFDPDDHSDQHTFVRYAFVGGTYTESEPA